MPDLAGWRVMDQRIDFLTVATPSLDAARAFYVDGLGWTPTLDVPGEIVFFQIGPGVMLGLYDAAAYQGDLDRPAEPIAVSGVTLSHNVGSASGVDAVVAAAVRAGAVTVKAPQAAAFGGRHGFFADPNGLLWEVAYNPGWRVLPDGTVTLDVVT